MSSTLIWLNDDALRANHPVFKLPPAGSPAIYVWDDTYLRQMDYSLKRLVFLYESLCELPIDIVRGDTREVLRADDAQHIFMPATHNPLLRSIADQLAPAKQVTVVEDDPFVILDDEREFVRFAQYWKRAQKSALLRNGGQDA